MQLRLVRNLRRGDVISSNVALHNTEVSSIDVADTFGHYGLELRVRDPECPHTIGVVLPGDDYVELV